MNKVEINDLTTYTNLGKLQTKGHSLVFATAIANRELDGYDYTLKQVKDGQILPLTSFGKESSFVFLDENTILFAGNRKEIKDKTFIYQLSLNGGEAVEIAELTAADFAISDVLDETHLLLSRRVDLREAEKKADKDSKDYEVLDELPSYFNGQGIINKLRDKLFVYDLQTKQLKELPTGDELFDVGGSWVHGDFVYYTGDSFDRVRPLKSAFWRINYQTGEKKQLLATGQFDIYDVFFMNETVYAVATDQKTWGEQEYPQIYRLSDGQFELALPFDNTFGGEFGSDICLLGDKASGFFNGKYYFTTTAEDHSSLLEFDGQSLREVFSFAAIDFFSFTPDGSLYFTGAATDGLPELYEVKAGQTIQLSNFNEAAVAGKYLAKVEQVNYQGVDGENHGWVLKPKDYEAGKKYPAILNVHGGPNGAYGTVFFHEMQVWASHGYFVFFANIHGSAGKGNAFADMQGKWGTVDYTDLMAFTDAVLAAYPDIDEQNLGITGGSYGGYMTNWVIGQTHRFKAAAAQRSMSNWLSDAWLSDVGPYDDFFSTGAKNDFRENLAYAWEQSPVAHAKEVTTPTLFIHSDEDYRCPLPEGMSMFHALLYYGTEARLVLFHGENHELSRSGQPKHRIRRLTEITNWFDKHLK